MNEELSRLQQQAEQDDADAQYNLGFMYAEGQGVPQSDAKAIEWYEKAAKQGHKMAEENLRILKMKSSAPPVSSKSDEPKGLGWFIKCLKHYADFKGRARRKEFWMFALFYWIFLVPGTLLWMLLFSLLATHYGHIVMVFVTLGYGPAYVLALLLPLLAVSVRRLHDLGRSGWWMLLSLASFIPVIGIFIPIGLIVLMCLDSQSGANEYGLNPKGQSETKKSTTSCILLGVILGVSIGALLGIPGSYFFQNNILQGKVGGLGGYISHLGDVLSPEAQKNFAATTSFAIGMIVFAAVGGIAGFIITKKIRK